MTAGVDDAWAQRMATTTMAARPDFAEIQASAIEWLRETITSAQFVCGVILGVALAEGWRFIWRGAMRTFSIAHTTIGFVMHHRLIAAGIAAAIGYGVVYAGMV